MYLRHPLMQFNVFRFNPICVHRIGIANGNSDRDGDRSDLPRDMPEGGENNTMVKYSNMIVREILGEEQRQGQGKEERRKRQGKIYPEAQSHDEGDGGSAAAEVSAKPAQEWRGHLRLVKIT
jgi:hypothetical protein